MSLTIIRHSFGTPPVYYLVVSLEPLIPPGFAEIPPDSPYRLLDFLKYNLCLNFNDEKKHQDLMDVAQKRYQNNPKKHCCMHVIELDSRFEKIDYNLSSLVRPDLFPLEYSDLVEIFSTMLQIEASDKVIFLPNKHVARLLLSHIYEYAKRKHISSSFGRLNIANPTQIFSEIPELVPVEALKESLLICWDTDVLPEQYKTAQTIEAFLEIFEPRGRFRALPFGMRITTLKTFREWLPGHVFSQNQHSLNLNKIIEIYFVACLIDNYLAKSDNKKRFLLFCKDSPPFRCGLIVQSMVDKLMDGKPLFFPMPHYLNIIVMTNALYYLDEDLMSTVDAEKQYRYLMQIITQPKDNFFTAMLKTGRNPIETTNQILNEWLSKRSSQYADPMEYRLRKLPKIVKQLVSLNIDSAEYLYFRSAVFAYILTLIQNKLSYRSSLERELNNTKNKLLTFLLCHCVEEKLLNDVIKLRNESDQSGLTQADSLALSAIDEIEIHHYEMTDIDQQFMIYVTPGIKKDSHTLSLDKFEHFWQKKGCQLIFAIGIPEDDSNTKKHSDFPAYYLTGNSQCVAKSNDTESAIRVYEVSFQSTKRYVCHIPRPDRPPLDLSKEDLLFIYRLLQHIKFTPQFKNPDGKLVISAHCWAGLHRSPTLAAILANILKTVVNNHPIVIESAIAYARSITCISSRLVQSSYDKSYHTIIHEPYESSVILALRTFNELLGEKEKISFFSNAISLPLFSPTPHNADELRVQLLITIENAFSIIMPHYHGIISLLSTCKFEPILLGLFTSFHSELERYLVGEEILNTNKTKLDIQSCIVLKEDLVDRIQHTDSIDLLLKYKRKVEKILLNTPILNAQQEESITHSI